MAVLERDPNLDIEVFDNKPHHNCGVAGVALSKGSDFEPALVAAQLLDHLQHRGPDGAGVAVAPRRGHRTLVTTYADIGPVSEVLSRSHLNGLPDGEYAVGQVRYPTQGRVGAFGRTALQPIGRKGRNGLEFWFGHNGDLNFDDIGEFDSDTYKGAHLISQELVRGTSLPQAMTRVFSRLPDSAYSITGMTRKELIAIRDPYGRHPLFYGYSDKAQGFLVASETPALTNLGVKDYQYIPAGHIGRFVSDKEPEIVPFVENPKPASICMLEAIYFARADGMLDEADIYKASKAAGELLALKDAGLDFDIVVPVPDSARAAAQGYASRSGRPYTEGFVKLGSHRSFLQNDQAKREIVADHKLQIIPSQVRGQRIVLVEDSIVRGTTMMKLVLRLKEFGAKEVHLRIASPPLKFTCEYGIDIPTRQELIAFQEGGDVEKIRARLGADSLKYLEVPESRRALGGRLGKNACMKCFTGRKPSHEFEYVEPVFKN